MKILLFTLLFFELFEQDYRKPKGCFANKDGTEPEEYWHSSGNQSIDQITGAELNFLSGRFGVRPGFFFYNDNNGKNSYATEDVYNSNFSDGTVFFGKRMFNSESISSWAGTSIPIVIAHEFGHIVDFKYGALNEPGIRRELFADYFAGLYMSIRNRTYAATDINACAKSFERMGDTDFGNPNHHGTPKQRQQALYSGYNLMETYFNTGRWLDLNNAIESAKSYVAKIPLPADDEVKDVD